MNDQTQVPPKKAVWLASYPKSGNTWIRMFLASYVADKPEFNPNEALRGSFHDAMREAMDKLLNVKTADLDVTVIAALRLPYLTKLIETGKNDLLVKTHIVNGNWHNAPMVPIPVTRRAIYVVRHPFDVVISFAKHMGIEIDDAIAAMNNPDFGIGSETQVQQPLHTWSKHVESWMECVGYPHIVIRYEDMHARPHLTFSNLVTFMDMAADSARIERAIEQTKFDKMKALEAAEGFKEESENNKGDFFSRGITGGWRDVLSTEQTQRIWLDHQLVMTRLGYGPDGEF